MVALGGAMRLLSAEKSLYTVEAFLPEVVPEDSIAAIKTRLEHTKHIETVEFVSADSALADFQRHFSGEMLELVDENPLPPFFRLTLPDVDKTPSMLQEVRNELLRESFFEEVQAPIEWVNRIAAWKFKMVFWPITLSVLLIITLSLIICNSVRLSLLSRKLLVENMKYAGGSYFFIEFPFVMEGFIQGFVGSGLSAILLATIVRSISEAVPLLSGITISLGLTLVTVVFLVSLLSAYFSFRTVRGFLHAKRNEQE